MSKIFIISGPSGAGEDSVIAGLKKTLNIEKIVTTTTRDLRPGETDGQDYYFVSKEEFEKGVAENKFFEWAEEDNGNFYGCTFDEIERIKKSDKIIIWKLEYQGVITAKKILPEAVSIFISVPLEIIESRLKKRGHQSEGFIKSRINYAKGWFDNRNVFDYEVMNEEGKLNLTIKKVVEIINNNINK